MEYRMFSGKNEEFVGYKIDAMGVDWDMKHRLF